MSFTRDRVIYLIGGAKIGYFIGTVQRKCPRNPPEGQHKEFKRSRLKNLFAFQLPVGRDGGGVKGRHWCLNGENSSITFDNLSFPADRSWSLDTFALRWP